jgi:transposase-like protein
MRKRKSYTRSQHQAVIDLWTRGEGRVRDIADRVGMPATTIYGILERAGVWPGYDDPHSRLGSTAENRLNEMLAHYPSARRQIEINKQNTGKPMKEKVNLELGRFMWLAHAEGFTYKEIALVVFVDAKTVKKYVSMLSTPLIETVKLAEAQNMSLPIQFAEPEPGLLRRVWGWLTK